MMSGVELQSVADWPRLLSPHALALALPGTAYGAFIYVLLRTTKSRWQHCI